MPISKLFIHPGTGVDSSVYNPDNLFLERSNIGFIDSQGKFNNDASSVIVPLSDIVQ